MNALVITFIIVGVFLVLVGVTLLVVKIQVDSDSGFKPIFQGPGKIMVSGPVGLVVIVIGVVCIGFSAVSYKINGSNASANSTPTPSNSVATASTTTPAPIAGSPSPGKLIAALTSPADGTKVSRSQGFTAHGTASPVGTDTIWILDYSGGYTVDQKAVLINGRWSALDQPLGGSSDRLPYSLTMVAALANPTCAARLTHVNETKNDYMTHLPAGCQLFGQVTVSVARP